MPSRRPPIFTAESTAVITGAASGIGAAIAELLARRGLALALVDVNAGALAEQSSILSGITSKVTAHHTDVADRAAVFNAADEIVRSHSRVNVLFNNAGVSVAAPFEQLSLDDFEWLMNINFWGMVYMTKALLPALTEAPRAAIVNVLSDFGLLGFPTKLPYCASKFAGRGFSAALRADLAHINVSVHEVYPPAVNTSIVASGRAWDADKQAREADFLRERGWTPQATAEAIIRGVERSRDRILIGRDTRLIDWSVRLFPSMVPRFVASQRHRVPFL